MLITCEGTRGFIPSDRDSGVFNLVYNSLESSGIVKGKVSENLTVDFNTSFVDETHELGIAEVLKTSGSIDTLNPERAEIALFVLAVTISVSKTFFPGVFSNCPHISAAAEVTTGEF